MLPLGSAYGLKTVEHGGLVRGCSWINVNIPSVQVYLLCVTIPTVNYTGEEEVDPMPWLQNKGGGKEVERKGD